MEALGAEHGDPWQLRQYSMHLEWGRNRGLQRTHYHLSQALELLMRGRQDQGVAYLVQLLRTLNQTNLDEGSWDTASLLLPKRDPLERSLFGGTQQELEVAAAYKKAMRDLMPARPAGAPGGEEPLSWWKKKKEEKAAAKAAADKAAAAKAAPAPSK